MQVELDYLSHFCFMMDAGETFLEVGDDLVDEMQMGSQLKVLIVFGNKDKGFVFLYFL